MKCSKILLLRNLVSLGYYEHEWVKKQIFLSFSDIREDGTFRCLDKGKKTNDSKLPDMGCYRQTTTYLLLAAELKKIGVVLPQFEQLTNFYINNCVVFHPNNPEKLIIEEMAGTYYPFDHVKLGLQMSIGYAAFAAKEKNLDISCLVRNSNDLYGIQNDSFDIVLCAMMLMDVEDFDGTMKEIYRVLRPDGKVFISILHPCFKPPVEHKWFKENDTIQVIVKNYFEPEEWVGEIAGIDQRVIYRHRTMSDYVKVFVRNKFKIIDLNEPKPTEEQRKMSPRIEWLTKIPMYMFIELAKD